jgi:pimeloyl-ACP methyl ester carboxylesterase
MSNGPHGLYVVEHEPPTPGAPRVLMVHGAMDRSTSFAKVARRLGDLRVVRYDRRGYGHSRAVGPGTFAEHLDDLFAIIGDEACTVAGHSYGATLSMAAAVQRPDLVRSLMVYEPPLPWLPGYADSTRGATSLRGATSPEDSAERFMRFMIGSSRWERLPSRTKSERRAEGPALVADMDALSTGAVPFAVVDVSVPVVAVRGSNAETRHVLAGDHLADELPDVEVVIIEGADHGGHLTHPGEFAGAVRRAVERAGQ